MNWSMQRVEQLAPDAAAIKAAQGLVKPAKWKSLGHTDRFVWGECQGSGANPYQVRVDLDDGAIRRSRHSTIRIVGVVWVPRRRASHAGWVISANIFRRASCK